MKIPTLILIIQLMLLFSAVFIEQADAQSLLDKIFNQIKSVIGLEEILDLKKHLD